MFQVERVNNILEYINARNRADIAELSSYFGVSQVTIRRDIDLLVEEGQVIKTHGGVISAQSKFSFEIPYNHKITTNAEKKRRIGLAAADLINDNDTIILDAGTTTLHVAKAIKSKNVTVITNDINVAREVATMQHIDVFVTGGKLEKGVYTLTGSDAVKYLKKIHANKVFIGVDALDLEFGISNRSVSEIDIKLAMKEAADQVILISDSSKFGQKLFYSLFPLEEVNVLITDIANDEIRQFMSNHNKTLIETDLLKEK